MSAMGMANGESETRRADRRHCGEGGIWKKVILQRKLRRFMNYEWAYLLDSVYFNNEHVVDREPIYKEAKGKLYHGSTLHLYM